MEMKMYKKKRTQQQGNVKAILLVIAGLIAVLGITFVSIRNSFVTMNETIDGAWAQVENQMKRRADLIPNLVNTVKGYATHEKGVFEKIAESRAKMAGAKTTDDKVAASRQFESALSRLMVVVEQYPNLKADAQFNRLMDELSGSENRLSVERMRYNEQVKLFNQQILLFPKNIVASMSGLKKREYFEVSEKDKEVPRVTF